MGGGTFHNRREERAIGTSFGCWVASEPRSPQALSFQKSRGWEEANRKGKGGLFTLPLPEGGEANAGFTSIRTCLHASGCRAGEQEEALGNGQANTRGSLGSLWQKAKPPVHLHPTSLGWDGLAGEKSQPARSDQCGKSGWNGAGRPGKRSLPTPAKNTQHPVSASFHNGLLKSCPISPPLCLLRLHTPRSVPGDGQVWASETYHKPVSLKQASLWGALRVSACALQSQVLQLFPPAQDSLWSPVPENLCSCSLHVFIREQGCSGRQELDAGLSPITDEPFANPVHP